MKIKKRLDQLLHEMAPALSRRRIQSCIMQGKVRVDGIVVTKPGTQITEGTPITFECEEPKYVSRAGFKLEKALDHFALDVTDAVALDAGLSTGGFTDCLLQRGAQKVYGVDVGYGQVDEKMRQDDRVVLMERTNLRTLQPLDELLDLVTLDLSFISVLKVMDAVTPLLKSGGQLIVLIKPQFEAERHEVGRGGIVKDSAIHEKVINKISKGIQQHGFTYKGVVESPILGAQGNKEFLAYFVKR